MSFAITIARGAALTLEFNLVDKNDGTPLPLDGRYVEFCVVSKLGAATEIMTKSTAVSGEGQIIDAPNGVARIYLISTETNLIEPGSYRFDVWVIEDDDHEYPAIIGGAFTVTQRGCVTPGGT